MKILVLGIVTLNGGDAAIGDAQLEILNHAWPGVSVLFSDSHPEAAARYRPDLGFTSSPWDVLVGSHAHSSWLGRLSRVGVPVKRLLAARARYAAAAVRRNRPGLWRATLTKPERVHLAQLAEADLVVWTGGTTLVETYDLTPKIFDMEVVRQLGLPYAYMPQSAGPYSDVTNRAHLLEQMSGALTVILRDERSRRNVIDLGVPAHRTAVCPDTVFALARGDRQHTISSSRLRVAVSVRSWKFFQTVDEATGMAQYLAAVAEAINHLVRKYDAQVELVSTCQGRAEYWTDDSETAQTLAALLPDDVVASVRVDGQARTAHELIEHLADFDVCLATRLHTAILAVDAAVPTVAIAYEFKTVEVWSQLGLEEFVVTIDDVDASGLIQRMDVLIEGRADLADRLAVRTVRMALEAMSAGTLIKAALERRL